MIRRELRNYMYSESSTVNICLNRILINYKYIMILNGERIKLLRKNPSLSRKLSIIQGAH